MKAIILDKFNEALAQTNVNKVYDSIDDDLVLLESELDSLGFAILVALLKKKRVLTHSRLWKMPCTLIHLVSSLLFMRNTVTNSTSLLSRLLNVPSERAFLICPNVELTFGDVQEKVHRLQSQLEELRGKNVALVAKDRASLAVYLLAVQDMSRSVYLQSSDIGTETEKVFYQCSDIDYRLEVKNLDVISLDCVGSSSTGTSLSCGQVILATSGTTGTPKLASYSVSSLMSTCQANIQRGEEFNWGYAMT